MGWMEAFNKRCCDPNTRGINNVHMGMYKHLCSLGNDLDSMKVGEKESRVAVP